MKQIYPQENQLIKACQENDSQAQFELFERYKVAMFNLVYRMSYDYDLANDILQEGFIEVFRNISKFRQESTLGAWIKKIMIRKALKQINGMQLHESLETVVEVGGEMLEGWIDGEMLDQAISQLPKGARTVFVLFEVEGYTHQEVAKLLQITESTSKSQLHYAKKLLKELLNKELKHEKR